MKSVICFKVPPFGKLVCIRIYYAIKEFPFKPDPNPWKRKYFEDLNEHFSEAIKAEAIKKDVVTDIAILSAIRELSSQLSPEIAKGFQENIKAIAQQFNKENEGFEVKI